MNVKLMAAAWLADSEHCWSVALLLHWEQTQGKGLKSIGKVR